MADYRNAVITAIVRALKADPSYTGFIPKAQVYDETVPGSPPWPFSRIASVVATPFRATGLSSSAFRVNVQPFSKDVTDNAGTVLLPAASNVGLIASAAVDVLDGATLRLPSGLKLSMTWVQTSPSIDGEEAGAWKASVIFTGEVYG